MSSQIMIILEIIVAMGSAIILHECAHGWVALKLGDSTARDMGRLTLNPLRHIDPVGTLLVPLVCYLVFKMPFGWAKPVPVNFTRLRNPKQDMILVALAGPAVNICLALIASRLIPLAAEFFSLVVIVNLILATFNMTPVPPLDGSRVVAGLLPISLARQYLKLEPYGFMIVLILLNTRALDFMFQFAITIASLLGVPRVLLN